GYLCAEGADALVAPASVVGNGAGNVNNGGGNGGEPLPLLGAPDDLPRVIRERGVEEVFIAAPEMNNNDVLNLVSRCEDGRASFYLCANILEVITDRVKIDDFGDLPVIPFKGTAPAPLQAAAKRALDLAVSLGLLALFALPMLAIT